MTYRELQERLQHLNDEQLDCDVTLVDLEVQEVQPAIDFVRTWWTEPADAEATGRHVVDGVLDEDHPYITFTS